MKSANQFLICCAALGSLALGLISCGGGGGGGGGTGGGTNGASNGVLTYFTNFASTNQGESEVVSLYVGSTLEQKQLINAPAKPPGTGQLTFRGLSSGTYLVQAVLYSGPAGTGNAIGTAQATISGAGASTVTTDPGGTATSVVVAPATASVLVGQTTTLVAEAIDSNGYGVFESTVPTWTVSPSDGSIATVGANTGIVTGVATGKATVTAAYGSLVSSQANSAVVTVNSATNAQGTWTIMLFLNASNSLDYFSYGSPANQIEGNVPQIEQIAQTPTSATKFVMQWKLSPTVGSDIPNHPFNGTRRYLATQNANASASTIFNGLDLIQDMGEGIDMGSPTTLTQFVQWAEKTYPAQHYALILWDHGNGWERLVSKPKYRAISEDDETGNIIEVWKLGSALANTNLDILSFDACLMQMVEVQNEVASDAHYMVCSEDNTPGPGYQYNSCFAPFFTNPNASDATLAEGIVTAQIAQYPPSSDYGPVSQSVVDLTQIPTLVSAMNSFSQALKNAGSSISSTVSSVRQASTAYDGPDGYFYYDIGSITQRFVNANPTSAVGTAAAAVLAAEKAAVVYSQQNGLSSDSTGISIEFGNQPEFAPVASDYSNLKFASQTSWPTFLDSTTLNPSP